MAAVATARARAPAPKPAIASPTDQKSTKFVTVCCKVAGGMVLQLQQKEDYLEEGLNGSRMRVRWSKVGKTYTVRGPAAPAGAIPRGYTRPTVVGGFALTPNIPKDFWDEWLEQNAKAPYVESGMIFAHGTRSGAVGTAREHAEFKSGLEPLDPDGDDPRMPKPIHNAVSDLAPAAEMGERQGLPDQEDDGED